MAGTGEPISKRLRRRTDRSVPTASSILSAPRPSNLPSVSAAMESTKPDENAPLNSLLRLSDVCLQAVFEHLDIGGLCQMANVCKRSRENAEQVFSERHKEFELKGYTCTNSMLRRVLCKFGHLIKSFDASEAYFQGEERIDLNAIVKYCTTLDGLTLQNAQINCDMVRPLFARLKDLDLDMCEFIGDANSLFGNCKQLEHLGYDHNYDSNNSCRFLGRHFPKLQGLRFDSNFSAHDTFFQLLRLNPQLKYLHVQAFPEDIHVESVVWYTKNLERLIIRPGTALLPEIQTKEGLLKLSKLKKLTELTLDAGCETYAQLVGPLMNAFAKANIALDFLELGNFEINSNDIKSIANIKTMDFLILDRVERVFNEDLVTLTTKLPLLSTLHLHFGYDEETKTPLTTDGLVRMVKGGMALTYLGLIGVRNMKIDEKVYANLVEAIKSRAEKKKLTIDVFGCRWTCSFNVPQNVLQADIQTLVVRYKEKQECQCEHCDELEYFD